MFDSILVTEWRREATSGPGRSGEGAGAQRDRGHSLGHSVQAVPQAAREEGPGARPGLRESRRPADHRPRPDKVSLLSLTTLLL